MHAYNTCSHPTTNVIIKTISSFPESAYLPPLKCLPSINSAHPCPSIYILCCFVSVCYPINECCSFVKPANLPCRQLKLNLKIHPPFTDHPALRTAGRSGQCCTTATTTSPPTGSSGGHCSRSSPPTATVLPTAAATSTTAGSPTATAPAAVTAATAATTA